jgi:hypothetical protein
MKNHMGWIVLSTLVFYLLSLLIPFMLAAATLSSWLVLLLVWRTLGRGACNQALLLLIIGCIFLLFSAYGGVFLGWQQILGANLPLLAMFVAVSFLSMTSTGVEDKNLPKGKRAVIITAIGTHLLGSVINLSVLFVFGDRLQKNGVLTRTQLIILARSFCAAAWWSPFFIATGVALTYSPGMSLQKTLIPGVIMSVIAIVYSIAEVCYFRKEEFSGYPFKTESLTLPLFLAAIVICVHYFRPDISILKIICLLSPVGAIIFMKFRPRIPRLYEFITTKVGSVSSQFALFLAAGVFSTGIKSLTYVYPALFSLKNPAFTPTLFSAVLGLMIIAGIVGVHPVVSISIVSPLLLPLDMDHSQIGFLFLSTWAISTGSSPLSGVGLALVSRYQASPAGILTANWHYAFVMWAFACVMNLLFFA